MKRIFTILPFFLFFIGSRFVISAELQGPAVVELGMLAVFESDISGDFLIFPKAEGTFKKDSGGKAVYFASPNEGEYTVIFFGVESGKPSISQFDFYVEKSEPEPEPKPFPMVISETEHEAFLYAVTNVISAIASKTVRTPQGARASFKKFLTMKLGTGKISPEFEKEIEILEKSVDLTSLSSIQEGFQAKKEELERSK